MLISELSANADAYQFSTFFHKDRNGKLRAGPIWDNDLTYGNDLFFWGLDRSKTDLWQFANNDNEGSKFWIDLFNNSDFGCYLSKRWYELTLTGQPLNYSSLTAYIDQTVAEISEAVMRENALWGTIGNHAQHITDIKSWLNSRINWITANLGPYSGCQNVAVPPLVITKIMYHPDSVGAYSNNDLEFIEITNNSDQTVDLTGVYFSGTGFVYQFPVNATLKSHANYAIAGDVSAFQSHYGCSARGQFTRHLSNKSQNLVLADAFGNVIDNVQYMDTIPWPDADGNGYYLQLTDPGLDNAVAANWTASNEVFVAEQDIPAELDLQLYPNPVIDILSIQASADIEQISLFDMQGRLLVTAAVNNESYELDMSRFMKGTYIIRIITADRTYISKIIKD
jgi:hypothetical protein